MKRDFADIHCHILPQVDDGSKSLEMTGNMLKKAYEEGIRTIFATPHFHPVRGKNDSGSWEKAMLLVKREIAGLGLELELLPGCEILYQQDTLADLKSGKARTLAETPYVLVEFPENTGFGMIRQGLGELRRYGYYPILAHVERYADVFSVDRVERLIDDGIYIQMNASTVLRGRGLLQGREIRKLLKRGDIHFAGTDAHNDSTRAPVMEDCAVYIEKLCGRDCAERICGKNALSVARGEKI